MRFGYDFYKKDALTLAKRLLGKNIVRVIDNKKIVCKIVETEAYMGVKDKGSHAYNYKKTKKAKTMYKRGGHAYVYLIYGIHNCLNIVSGEEKDPQAVLIRAAEPVTGIEYIKENRNIGNRKIYELTNGPGKLCKALSIDRRLDGYDLSAGNRLYIEDGNVKTDIEIVSDKRINIDYAKEYKDKLWRFYIKKNRYVSK